MEKLVRIKVPATTANIGPGFDCLGMALDIWNYVEFTITDEKKRPSNNYWPRSRCFKYG